MYKNQFYLSPPIKEGAEIQQYPEQVFCHPERRDLQYWEGHHWASTRTRCPALSQLRGPAGSPERREPGPLGSIFLTGASLVWPLPSAHHISNRAVLGTVSLPASPLRQPDSALRVWA